MPDNEIKASYRQIGMLSMQDSYRFGVNCLAFSIVYIFTTGIPDTVVDMDIRFYTVLYLRQA